MGTGTCWRCGASEDGALSSYGDPRDAEIAALKAEVETAKAWQGAAVLRNYDAVRILTEEIGTPGPENIDETARRAVMVIRAHKRALAAGPAALRSNRLIVAASEREPVARAVEAAQEAAMKVMLVSCVSCELSDKCPGFDDCPHLAAQATAMKEGK